MGLSDKVIEHQRNISSACTKHDLVQLYLITLNLTSHKPAITMPSRSNPNTPSSSKRKTAHTLKTKRQNTQRLTCNKITKPTATTSQALRRAAPLSKKKARKLERNANFARKRKMVKMREVEMKDVDAVGKKKGKTEEGGKSDELLAEEKMEVDWTE